MMVRGVKMPDIGEVFRILVLDDVILSSLPLAPVVKNNTFVDLVHVYGLFSKQLPL